LAQASGRPPDQIAYEEIARVKALLTRALAPHATAVLTDPEYGYPYSIPHLPPRVGLLLAQEQTGYEKAGPEGRERLTRLLEGWTATKAGRAGADAVKLLIFYHPDAAEETRGHQREVVQRVGEASRKADMPFLLEIVTYPLGGRGADTPEFARAKPELVARSAAEFSAPEFYVDILKLEFPADLKYTSEFAGGAFDGRARDGVYSLQDVKEYCKRLDEASGVPWVILSAGVDIEEFLIQVRLACEAGASGFLCGRAIWKDALVHYPDEARMEETLRSQGVYNFVRANAYAERALPWHRHRRFDKGILLDGQSPTWYLNYPDPQRGGL
jgi:tagatose 1,6-diphosphate aldolase